MILFVVHILFVVCAVGWHCLWFICCLLFVALLFVACVCVRKIVCRRRIVCRVGGRGGRGEEEEEARRRKGRRTRTVSKKARTQSERCWGKHTGHVENHSQLVSHVLRTTYCPNVLVSRSFAVLYFSVYPHVVFFAKTLTLFSLWKF